MVYLVTIGHIIYNFNVMALKLQLPYTLPTLQFTHVTQTHIFNRYSGNKILYKNVVKKFNFVSKNWAG